jgi:hypothetical protein
MKGQAQRLYLSLPVRPWIMSDALHG